MGFYRTWFLRGVRLAPVVGLAAAGWHLWSVMDRYQEDVDAQFAMRTAYECAARQSSETLEARQNAYGNINVRDLCLPGRDFIVSWPEVEQVRQGTMTFETTYQPFDWQGAAIMGIAWAALTLLTLLAILSAIAVARWIWGQPGVARGESSPPPSRGDLSNF